MKSLCWFLLVLLLPAFLQAQFSDALLGKKPIRNSIWLQKVSIGNWNFTSGVNDGYYLVEDSKLTLRPDSTYVLQLELGGYPRVQDTAYLRVWIDLNQDKDFEDAGEQVWEGKTLNRAIARGEFKLPAVESGTYVLRVLASKKAYGQPSGEQAMVIEMEDYHFRAEPFSPCQFDRDEYVQILKTDYTSATIVLKNNDQIRYDLLLTIRNFFEPSDFRRSYQNVSSDTLKIEGLRELGDYELFATLTCPNGDTIQVAPQKIRANFSVASNCGSKKGKRIWFDPLAPTLMVVFVAENDSTRLQGRYRKKGDTQWLPRIKEGYNQITFQISEPGQEYEYQVRIFCPESKDWGDWSAGAVFLIESCRLPTAFSIDMETEVIKHPTIQVRLAITGGMISEASYKWSHRKLGADAWIDSPAPHTNLRTFEGLEVGSSYEIRSLVICPDGNSIAVLDTVTIPMFCDVIRPKDLFLLGLADTHARIWMRTGRKKVGYEFRIRPKGDSTYTYIQYKEALVTILNDVLTVRNLQANTKYELSIRLICGQDSVGSTDWSAPYYFTTYSCNLPKEGEIALVEMNVNQPVVLSADFINHLGGINYDYHWKIKATNETLWKSSLIKGTNRISLNNLVLNQTYEVQVVVKCPLAPQDSLRFTTKFVYAIGQCNQKPDLAYLSYTLRKDSTLIASFKLPANYKVQIRTRRFHQEFIFSTPTTDLATYYLPTLGQTMALQFRLICPNGNVSPWSDTIWIDPLKPFGAEELQEEYAEGKNSVQIVSAEDVYPLVTYSSLDTCARPNILNIKVKQDRWYNAQLSYLGVDNKSLQWRYRKKGAATWRNPFITTNPITNIEFESGGGEYEIQVRQNCANLGVWSEWSESLLVEFAACVFPDAKDIRFDTSFSAFPSLRISILLLQRADPFSFKWYYRELGQTTWVDTIQSTTGAIIIQNLSPGKVYEVRVDVRCGNDFVSYFKRIEVPPSCLVISKINIREVHDSSVFVDLRLGQTRMIEYRYRIVGQTNYSFTKLRTGSYLKGLIPGTTYEISARVVCEDTLLVWSPSLVFTTKNCKLPLAGDISLLQFNTQDAATFSADYLNFNFPVQHDYTWRYKPSDQNLWATPVNGKQQQFTLSNLLKGQKYDLSVAIACPNHPQDSLRLETSFTAELNPCTEQPDTASVQITFQESSLDPVIRFKSPKGYRYQMRTKPENGYFVQYFSDAFEDKFLTVFSLHPGMNDFQFRLICPNGNKSPWSAVIKLFNRKNPGTIKAPKIHSGLVDRLTDAPQSGTIRVIPNPSPGKIDVVFPELTTPLTGAMLEVFNTSGQRVLTLKTSIAPTQKLPLDLSNQTPGLYILRIQAGQKVYTERVIIGSNR